MSEADRTYIPAAGRDWLLPLYDPVVKLMGGESAHRQLIDQAVLQPGQRILEIGCGTGNLTILVKTLYPAVDVVGVDPDAKALDRARRKADRQRVSVRLDRGFADELHYPDESHDRVLSAFMFHHLERDEKTRSLREIRRVLKPGGSLHLLDFGWGHDRSGRFLAHLLHRSHHVRDDSGETIVDLMRQGGLDDPAEVAHRRTIFGRIVFYQASRPQRAEPGAI